MSSRSLIVALTVFSVSYLAGVLDRDGGAAEPGAKSRFETSIAEGKHSPPPKNTAESAKPSPQKVDGLKLAQRPPKGPGGPGGPGGPKSGGHDDGRSRSKIGIQIGPGGVDIFKRDQHHDDRHHPSHGDDHHRYDRGRNSWYYGSRPWYWDRDGRWKFYLDFRSRYPGQVVPYYYVEPGTVVPVTPQTGEAEPPVPSAAELAQVPTAELRGFLLFAVDRLDDDLDELSTGADWKAHLQTADLKRLVPESKQAPPPPVPGAVAKTVPNPSLISPKAREELTGILQKFDTVQRNPAYQMISGLWGFRAVQVALAEFLVPPFQRSQHQLAFAIDVLSDELGDFSVGASWKQHLKLDALKKIAEKEAPELNSNDIRVLHSIQKTFDDVSKDTDYQTISELSGFKRTLYALGEHTADVDELVPPAPKP